MVQTITVSGTCDIAPVHRAVRTLNGEPLVIDLSAVTFVLPGGLTGIAALAQAARQQSGDVRVLAPVNPNVANYLARLRLGAIFDDLGAAHDLPTVTEHATDSLYELQPFASSDDVLAFAEHIHNQIEPADKALAGHVFSALCEAGDNVGHHSGQDRGYLAAQRLGGTTLHFAVADAGRGYMASLNGQGARDDVDALTLAIEPGVSSVDDIGRGYGLSAMCASVSALRGSVTLASGYGRITVDARGTRVLPGSRHPLTGVLIAGTVPVSR